MAASFPTSVKSFSDIVDGTDYMEADNINQAYDEIEAVETMLGALGRAQSYSAALAVALGSYRTGCSVTYKSATEIYVAAGQIGIPDSSGNIGLRVNTSVLTIDWSDIDTGSEASSTKYYVYAIGTASATTFTVAISTNATTPSGGTYFKKIGEFYNNDSGHIAEHTVRNLDPVTGLPAVGGFKSTNVSVFATTAPTSWTDLDVSNVVGVNKVLAFFEVTDDAAGGFKAAFRTNGASEDTSGILSNDAYDSGTAGGYAHTSGTFLVLVETDTSGIVEWKGGAAVAVIVKLIGFILV